MSRIPKEPVKLVTVPSPNKIPERDIDKSPILECQHLGIDFGGLTAVDEFNMAIGRTEIAGLSGGDADLKALCTIDITDLQKAALDALS